MFSSLPVSLAPFFNRDRKIIALIRILFMCRLSVPLTNLFLNGTCDSKIFKKRISKFEFAADNKQDSTLLRSI